MKGSTPLKIGTLIRASDVTVKSPFGYDADGAEWLVKVRLGLTAETASSLFRDVRKIDGSG